MSHRVGRLTAIPADTQRRTGSSRRPRRWTRWTVRCRRIVDECYEEACRLLANNRDRLDSLAGALLENETLDEVAAYRAAGITRS